MILAAITLKIGGGYGFLRGFALPITPDAASMLDWLVITMSLVAVVYIGLVALIQQDMKKLIAYSSIAHMGFVTLGFFIVFGIYRHTGSLSGAAMGVEGGMVQMVSHGFISGALFLCVGVLYDRMHSRQIKDYGGVVNTMPVFAAFMVLFGMANAGLPGTSGFIGEFLVILSSFKASFWIAFLAATTLILGAALHAVADQAGWSSATFGNSHVAELKMSTAGKLYIEPAGGGGIVARRLARPADIRDACLGGEPTAACHCLQAVRPPVAEESENRETP